MTKNRLNKKNIYLMGFMGSGKSNVGRLLAEYLNWSFLDTDASIVEDAGMSIPEIFQKHGESHFRQLEKQVVTRVSKLNKYVVSLGGGAILDQENWETIMRSGITVCLCFPPAIIMKHLTDKNDRPLLDDTEGESRYQRIVDLMTQREPHYKRADLVLSFNKDVDIQHVTAAILGYLKGT